jgi:serine/threonine protein phosphatase PrpC
MTLPVRLGVYCTRGIGPDRGGRLYNEDNYLLARDGGVRWRGPVGEAAQAQEVAGVLVAVADGMGGHEHGAVASEAAVQALCRLAADPRPPDAELALHTFILRAHRRLRERALARGSGNLGTTLTALWLFEHDAAWAHVGDSRLFLLRGGALTQLSRDHTRGEFAARDGRQPPPAAAALAQNFLFGSRGLGDDPGIRVDAGTDTGTLSLAPGDIFLLSSDGLHGFLAPDALARRLAADAPPDEVARRLVEDAMAAGSDDNLTALVVVVDALAPA